MTDTIYRGHVTPVGDGVAALYCLPCTVLILPIFGLLGRVPPDRRGIEQNLRALQRGESRALGIPLVPAHQHTNATKLRIKGPKTRVSRREVEFLVEEGIIRNVHLPIDPRDRAISIDDHRRIVIQSRSPALKQRCDDHHAMLLR